MAIKLTEPQMIKGELFKAGEEFPRPGKEGDATIEQFHVSAGHAEFVKEASPVSIEIPAKPAAEPAAPLIGAGEVEH